VAPCDTGAVELNAPASPTVLALPSPQATAVKKCKKKKRGKAKTTKKKKCRKKP
jgi:hypothetical protein